MDASQKFLVLVITKSWHFTVLEEAHDRFTCSQGMYYLTMVQSSNNQLMDNILQQLGIDHIFLPLTIPRGMAN